MGSCQKGPQCALLIYVKKPNVFRSGSPRDSVKESVRNEESGPLVWAPSFRRLALAMIPVTTMGSVRDVSNPQVVIRSGNQSYFSLPVRDQVKRDPDDERYDRKVDQHYMLRVLREQYLT
jgi:hypothetical protein